MHGSTSPAKKGLPSQSHPRHVPSQSHPRFHAAPAHDPSAPCRASSRAPAPSVATRARSAATCSLGAPVRSRIACQRIEGSESSSHCMTDLFGFGACRLGGLVAICWFSLLWLKEAVSGLPRCIRRLDGIERHYWTSVSRIRLPGLHSADAYADIALIQWSRQTLTRPALGTSIIAVAVHKVRAMQKLGLHTYIDMLRYVETQDRKREETS